MHYIDFSPGFLEFALIQHPANTNNNCGEVSNCILLSSPRSCTFFLVSFGGCHSLSAAAIHTHNMEEHRRFVDAVIALNLATRRGWKQTLPQTQRPHLVAPAQFACKEACANRSMYDAGSRGWRMRSLAVKYGIAQAHWRHIFSWISRNPSLPGKHCRRYVDSLRGPSGRCGTPSKSFFTHFWHLCRIYVRAM